MSSLVTNIEERLSRLHADIERYKKQYGRSNESLRLLAVSKRHTIGVIEEAYRCGQTHFGENFVQEAVEKIAALRHLAISWHFIGHLQSNKSRLVAENFSWVQTLDSVKLARRLDLQRPAGLAPLNICIQVKIGNEQSKSGLSGDDVFSLADCVNQSKNLALRGLMCIPEPTADFEIQRQQFSQLKAYFRQLKTKYEQIDTISMGMSGDFEAAIAEGSTMVRVGTAIFGPRY